MLLVLGLEALGSGYAVNQGQLTLLFGLGLFGRHQQYELRPAATYLKLCSKAYLVHRVCQAWGCLGRDTGHTEASCFLFGVCESLRDF